MEKQPFDNAGVAQVQSSILTLPIELRLQEVQAIRSDLTAWLQEHFEFTPPQQAQLLSLPADITHEIAEGIADTWQEGSLISFNKEEDDDKGFKDLLYDRISKTAYSFDTGTGNRSDVFAIWIKYH